jgi:hypothetical protein
MKNFNREVKNSVEDGLRDRLIDGIGFIKAPSSFSFFYSKNKIKALAVLLSSIFPEKVVREVKNKMVGIQESKLPFNVEIIKSFSEGKSSDIFLLKNRNSGKIYLIKIQKGFEQIDIYEEVIIRKAEWEHTQEIFNTKDVPYKIVPDEQYLLTNIGKRDAVIIMQDFLGEEFKDVFNDFTLEELKNTMNKNKELKEIFVNFLSKVIKEFKEKQLSYDFKGKNNLVIAKDKNGEERLYFIDPHDLLRHNLAEDKELISEREENIRYIEIILKIIQ